MIIQKRTLTRVPTFNSQYRCYDGCFHPDDWEIVWSDWVDVEVTENRDRIEFWRDLHEYACRERNESNKSEFRIVEESLTSTKEANND